VKKSYSPDLARDAAECDANYIRLCRLMPDQRDHIEFGIASHRPEATRVSIEVNERCRYTTMLTVGFRGLLDQWDIPRVMQVRVYHDLTTAEVTSCDQYIKIDSSYPYPNPEMHLPDEKSQLNHFLGEVLTHCLAHGRVLDCVYSQDRELQTAR
jgi:uncharacterized protein YqiB (DUF1249 family)